jgi:DNA-binding CsgD family transcriptional regulator/N-acetylneuraminic acid mutarotase
MAEKGEALSDRELEVLQCVVDGAGNKEIAATLVISQNTVKVHLRNIFTKLGVGSRTEATTVALQQGLVTLHGVVSREANTSPPEPGEETAVATPDQTAEPALAPRPGFFPKPLASISLLLLVAVLIFVAYQTLVGNNTPEPTPTPPFEETAITDDWLQSRSLPVGRANMALVSSGLNLYLIGGQTAVAVTNTVSIFHTADKEWREGAAKPTAVTDITGAELFGEIYIPGGKLTNGQPTNVVEVYSPANDSWRVATPLPTAVSGGLALSDGSFLYLFGGWNGQTYLANAYRFDPAANSWQILPSLTTARAFATGGVVKGKLYVVGGFDGERPLSECAYYDPATPGGSAEIQGSWHNCAPTLLPRAGAGAAGLLNKLYIFGGGAFSETPITYSESYNPDANQWSVVNTPALGDRPNWPHLGVTNVEIKIYALGGLRGEEVADSMFIYQPLTYQTYIPIAPVDGSNR